jgi:branched-subunit amino acid transport protein
MTAAPAVPLILSAVLFAAFAAIDWRRLPAWARIHLAVATAFALAALAHPWMTIHDVLGQGHDGLAYVVGLARIAGLVAALVSIATRLRELALR